MENFTTMIFPEISEIEDIEKGKKFSSLGRPRLQYFGFISNLYRVTALHRIFLYRRYIKCHRGR